MINRRTAKRQVAAARTLLQLIHANDITIPSASAAQKLIDAIERLHTSTESLARETYQNPNPQE